MAPTTVERALSPPPGALERLGTQGATLLAAGMWMTFGAYVDSEAHHQWPGARNVLHALARPSLQRVLLSAATARRYHPARLWWPSAGCCP